MSIWEMTYGECAKVAEVIEKKVKAEQEQQAMFAWKTAEMIGQYTAALFAKNASRPQSLYDAFPWIDKPAPDWRELKARMMARAQAHNDNMSR